MRKKQRKLTKNDQSVHDWEHPDRLKTLPKELLRYELNGQRFQLRAPSHVVAVARDVLERISGEHE